MKKLIFYSFVGLASTVIVFLMGSPLLPVHETLPMTQYAELPPGGEAKLCLGYNFKKDTWGSENIACPPHHAAYGSDDPAGVRGPAEKIRAGLVCCPLPSNDILSRRHVYVRQECPENFVGTGGKRLGKPGEFVYLLRCTRINRKRYQLASTAPGRYWGDGAAGWEGSKRVRWDNIPPAIRYAHGRSSSDHWDVDGCVGYPWGSLLSGKTSKFCGGFSFRQLQFGGLPGDPPRGTPVRMFPECEHLANLETPTETKCIKN